jgi:STE24 endopeptidase
VVWVVAAFFLLRTKVPADLNPPHLDARTVFGAGATRAGARFDRFFELEWIIATLATFGVLAVFLVRGPRLARRLGLGPVNAGSSPPSSSPSSCGRERPVRARRVVVVAAARHPAAQLVLDRLRAARRARQHDGLDDDRDRGRAAAGEALPRTWWLAAGGIVLVLAIGLQFVLPYLQRLGTHPCARGSSRRRSARSSARARGPPVVRVAPVSGETSAANAYSIGIGPSRSVIIWNTMLDGRFTSA